MKKGLLLLILFFVIRSGYSQNIPSANGGGTASKDYYAEIRCEREAGWFIVPVTINGKQRRFLLDTGAVSMFSKELAEELQLQPADSLSVLDQSGKKDSMHIYSLSGIEMGGIVFDEIPALLFKDTTLSSCWRWDGIIGSNLLRNSIVRFSPKDSTVIITDNPARINLKEQKKYASDLFLTPSQSSPYVWIGIKDRKKGRIQLLFDSGMTGLLDMALNHLNYFREKKIITDNSLLYKGKGSHTLGLFGRADDTMQYRFRLPELKIKKALFKNASAHTTADGNSRIGIELLKYGTVTVDYINKKFYFVPFFEKETDIYEKMNPISLSINNGSVVIGMVWDDRLRDELAVGDKVVAVNEVNLENKEDCELFSLMDELNAGDDSLLKLRDKDGRIKEIRIVKE